MHQVHGFFVSFFSKIEKGEEVLTLFVPNLTINLTYLCYGETKILVLWEITKGFKKYFTFLKKKKWCSSSTKWIKPWYSNIKKAEHAPPSFPKSYHELNLLMLWSSKSKAEDYFFRKLLDETPVNGLKCITIVNNW